MITIVYASRSTAEMDADQLTDLLEVARSRNSESEVTGMLVYAYESFMQQLEGHEDAVDAIFESIERDRRHTDLRLLSRRAISERRYADWAMGFEHPDAESLRSTLPGFSPAIHHPLVSAELVSTTEVAEAFLSLIASGVQPTADDPS